MADSLPPSIALTPVQREILDLIIQDQATIKGPTQPERAILLWSEGVSESATAEKLGISEEEVGLLRYRWSASTARIAGAEKKIHKAFNDFVSLIFRIPNEESLSETASNSSVGGVQTSSIGQEDPADHKELRSATRALIEILHHKPKIYGINRSNWTLASLATAYEKLYGQQPSKSTVGRLLKEAGLSWKKSRRVLTSPDPNYREKVELLLSTLQSLKADEDLFFIDELGPLQVKRYGGMSYKSHPIGELPGMVTPKNRFLIDAAFIVARTYKTFFGAPLLTAAGRDHTFTFGCVRDFLRLRRDIDIKLGILILGKETYSASSRDSILDLIVVLKELKIPHVHDPRNLALHIISHMRRGYSHIVTADKRFLQFCDDLIVVLPRENNQIEWDWKSSEVVKTTIGITPKDIPTYLTLTDPSSAATLTSKQAIRLVELYGSIDSIYKNLAHIVSAQIRSRLAEFETSIRQRYADNRCGPLGNSTLNSLQDISLNEINTANRRQVLVRYGFHSLLPLLANPIEVQPGSQGRQPRSESYHAVVDRKGIQKLTSKVRASKLCSIDTESDDKDPRTATLLGISFSVKYGEAFFVPLNEADLKDLTRDEVLKALKRIFDSDVNFIGHNIKYDCLILRRSGIAIKRVHFDTMLAVYECHCDWPFFNLPYVCKHYLRKEIKSYSDLLSDGSTFLDLPLRDMVNHACQDADITRRLYPILLRQLQERDIAGQFMNDSMGRVQQLINLEFDGVVVDVGQLGRIKRHILKQVARLSSEIFTMTGKVFDLESNQTLSEVLREVANLQNYIGPRRMTVSALEHLAIVEPVARLIVEVKRLRSWLTRLESISTETRNGKIYPLFNQIRSRTGAVASSGPSMFDIEGVPELKSCFESTVCDLFVDAKTSLNILTEVTKDPILIKVRKSKPKVDQYMAKHPLMQGLDLDDLLLRLAVGQSDTVLSKRFLVDRFKIATMRHDLEKRYQIMFQWLRTFRRATQAKGYATHSGQRKYIDGLKSSDIARRGQALEYAVRWLIRY